MKELIRSKKEAILMSNNDFPIQKGPAIPFGAQKPLATDSRTGAEHDVVFKDIRLGTQVDADLAASVCSPAKNTYGRPSESVSGINAGGSGRSISVKPVDCLTITGSTPGDHRSKDSDVAKSSLIQSAVGAGNPRGHVGQFPNSIFDSKNGSFGKDFGSKQYPGNPEDQND
jgi:hypothetical protein